MAAMHHPSSGMSKPLRGPPATLDTNVVAMGRAGTISPHSATQTASPVGSLIATPPVSPEPAYIAAREAGQIITREILIEFHMLDDTDLSELHESSLSQISDSALMTVNFFLDRILHNVLASSRSLSLANLRSAVKEVLKPRLAAEAIGGADEELIECIGEEDEVDLFEDATETMDGPFDLDLVWKRARLRCMVYTRLGDMEEHDEERYIEEHALDGYIDGRRMSRNNGLVSPPVAIWLTAILEFIGEHALMISSQAGYRRCENRYGKGMAGQALHPSVVTVSDSDLEKIALNPTLGRLWRAWRKPLKSPRPSISRALSVESMRHRRVDSKSSLGFARKASNETLGSVREPPQEHEQAIPPESMLRKDSLAEEPEAEEEEQAAQDSVQRNDSFAEEPPAEEDGKAADIEPEPAEIPLPMSEYDVDEIEVPGFTPRWENQQEKPLVRSKRPTSMAYPSTLDPTKGSETALSDGPRHLRSQSLPGARRPSGLAEFLRSRPDIAGAFEDTLAVDSRSTVADRPVSDVSQGAVFNSLKSPADYQTSGENTQKPLRRNRDSVFPTADRKSGLSEYGGTDGPVLFDRSDYRVGPNEEVPPMPGSIMSPHVTAATPTEVPSTPANGTAPARSGLRSNRPVSLAIQSPDKLAAPHKPGAGEVSPVDEQNVPASGEVSPLEPSDDEGSVDIAGLKDAKEHMSVGSSEKLERETYEDAPEVAAVSPISLPPEPATQTGTEAKPSPPRRELAPGVAAAAAALTGGTAVATAASRRRQEEPMVRQLSDEKRREAVVSPRARSSEASQKDDLPDIPKSEQINRLARAAQEHTSVAVPQPERIYRSMSKDMTNDGVTQQELASAVSSATAVQIVSPPAKKEVQLPHAAPATAPVQAKAPSPAPAKVAQPVTTVKIHRKEVSQERKQQEQSQQLQQSPSQPQGLTGVTPLQLQQGTSETTVPPTSKLLERRRQLPQVDTETPGRAAVQRLPSASPQSPDGGIKQLPARNVPEHIYPTPAPQVPKEMAPSAHRRPASRKASRSGDDAFGRSASRPRNDDLEMSKEFEQLIDSGETIQYTLTPQNIRSYQAVDTAPDSVPMQVSSSKDRPRGRSFTDKFGGKSRNNAQTTIVSAPVVNNFSTPLNNSSTTSNGFAGIPVRRPAGATPSNTLILAGKKSGLAPREAKVDMSSIRDFAEFMRSTGPNDTAGLSADPYQKVRPGPKPVKDIDILAKPQTAGLPAGMRSPTSPSSPNLKTSGSVQSSSSRRKGPKLLARDPQTNDKSTSELIDFIREGPPGEAGAHRIPRTVAPFRSTMDSEDMKNGTGTFTNGKGSGRYAGSVNSTQESFKTASGISQANSYTGLLANARGNNAAAMRGVEEEPSDSMMPTRKSRKPRDPYAIDFSDDEDEDDGREGTPRGGHRREESLIEFLQSQLPPANTNPTPITGGVSSLGRPIGSGPGMARPKPQARGSGRISTSETTDLADFLKNSGPPAAAMKTSVSGSVKKGSGIGGMFRRARG